MKYIRREWIDILYSIIFVLILLAGAYIRFKPLINVYDGSLPFGQGGFYVQVAKQILESKFNLPKTINYYGIKGYDYAYPPLLFYVEAIFLKLNINQFFLSSFLPALFSSISILTFWWLGIVYFKKDKWKVLFAFMFFLFCPASFTEVLPGDGLVEAFGQLISIVSLTLVISVLQKRQWKWSILLGISIGIAVISSPGSAYFVPILVLVYYIFSDSWKKIFAWKRIKFLILSVLIALVISFPYIFTVINNHGYPIFTDTLFFQYKGFGRTSIEEFVRFMGTGELYLDIIGVMVFFGFIYCVFNKNIVLCILLFSAYLVPREFRYLIPIPGALLASEFFNVIIDSIHFPWKKIVFIFVILIYIFLGALKSSSSLKSNWEFDNDALEAISWVSRNNVEKVVVLGKEIEWFPTLSKKYVPNAYFGGEWEKGWPSNNFYYQLESCQNIQCLSNYISKFGVCDKYLIYISKKHKNYYFIRESIKGNNIYWKILYENNASVVLGSTEDVVFDLLR